MLKEKKKKKKKERNYDETKIRNGREFQLRFLSVEVSLGVYPFRTAV